MKAIVLKIPALLKRIKTIGYIPAMDNYEKRRLGIFNLVNFFGFLSGLLIPVTALNSDGYLPVIAWVVACSPAVISCVVLVANYYHRHQFAMVWYFIMYPLITSLVYLANIDVGIELFFILYAVLALFFLQQLKVILLAISFSVVCFFVVHIIHQDYTYVLKDINFAFYSLNQFLSVAFIFIGLFLIKKENASYQHEMMFINGELLQTNQAISKQRVELADKAAILQEQTAQLSELNLVKDRLFSIISHDLKTPIYGLRNLFRNVERYDLPGDEIKILVPDILKDLNYTTGLLENLLLWAKSQMEGDTIHQQLLDVSILVTDVQQLLRLQAENKQVYVNSTIDAPIYIFADKDMIDLVLRNLLSNAIKYTPANGKVMIGASVKAEGVEVFVKDTGVGISNENMKRILSSNYFTTNGTASESGTGLGLMLCKEFLQKNGGEMKVDSEPGKGSKFSFCLPRP